MDDYIQTKRAASVGRVVLVALLLVTAAMAGPLAGTGGAALTSCTIIDTSGTYELTSSLLDTTNSCIEITASDVVLLGQGKTLDGTDGTGTVGILVSGSTEITNVTVQDLTVSDWDTGIHVDNGTDIELRNITAESSSTGIRLGNETERATVVESTVTASATDGLVVTAGSRDVTIRDTAVGSNVETGILIQSGKGVAVRNATVWNNTRGLEFVQNTDNATVSASTVRDNAGVGIYVGEHADWAAVTTSEIRNNGEGIRVRLANESYVAGNTVTGNAGPGINISEALRPGVDGNTVSGNTDGIRLHDASDAIVQNNTVENNGQRGIALVGAETTGGSITGNTVRGNGVGIAIADGGAHALVRNVIESSGTAGLRLVNTTGNVIDEGSISGGPVGVSLDASADNTFVDLTVSGASNWSYRSVNGSTGNQAARLRLGGANAIATTLSFGARDVALTTVGSFPTLPSNETDVGVAFQANATGTNAWLDTSVNYTDSGADGVNESTLTLWRHAGNWTELASGVNTSLNLVAANVTAFGLLAPLGTPVSDSTGTVDTTSPSLEVDPASVDFGRTRVDDTATATVTITNDGTAPLQVQDVVVTDDGGDVFTLEDDDTSLVLDPGATRTVTVAFTPSSGNEFAGTLAVRAEVGDERISLTGTGVASNLSVAPAAHDFGRVAPGQTPTRTFTVTNVGTGEQSVANVTVEGAPADAFEVVAENVTGTLTPGASSTITVAFTATTPGNHSATLRVATADPIEPSVATALSGRLVAPDVRVRPSVLDFADVSPGESATRTVTIANAGNANLTLGSVSTIGPGASAFEVRDTGSAVLEPGESRTLAVTFQPNESGPKSAVLRVLTDDPNEPQTDVYLTNTGTQVTTTANATASTSTVNVFVENATAGVPVSVQVSHPSTRGAPGAIDAVQFTPERSGNISLSISQRPSPLPVSPPFEPGDGTEPASFAHIDHSIDNANVSNVTITFRVHKERIEALEDTEADEVALYRYENGSFRELPTAVVDETDTHYIYRAESPGLSDFVTGVKKTRFRIANASVSVTEVRAGEGLNVVTRVTNTGGADGTFVVELVLEDRTVAKRTLTIAANGTRQTTFNRTFEKPGVYELYVNDHFVSNITVSERAGTTVTEAGTTTGSAGGGPGFGVIAALLALVATLVARARH